MALSQEDYRSEYQGDHSDGADGDASDCSC
jgi:hypothetical protein